MSAKVVYKYPWPWSRHELGPQDIYRLKLPTHARVVAFQLQPHGSNGNVPTMWIEQDLDLPEVEHEFRLYGTGHEIPSDAVHNGTLQMYDGRLVLHLYYMGVRREVGP